MVERTESNFPARQLLAKEIKRGRVGGGVDRDTILISIVARFRVIFYQTKAEIL